MTTLSEVQKLMKRFTNRAVNQCLLDEMHQYIKDNLSLHNLNTKYPTTNPKAKG